jgi:pimeloyl-ACP methyl ester carboxylesterase
MPQVSANGIQIEATRIGDENAPAILLIRGLGTQMCQWPAPFLEELTREFQVVIFDNRDVGLSQKFDEAGVPDLRSLMSPGGSAGAPYLLRDMAADCVGVLDAFGIEGAHVFGMSMGGMIAQEVAGRFPERTHSLISVMSSSGDPSVPPATPEAMRVLTESPERPEDRDCVVELGLKGRRIVGSPGYVDPDDTVRQELGEAFDRCNHPQGVARQMAAVIASGSRVELLRRVQAPALVIHGKDDPLVHPEGGRHTAEQIPGARLEEIEGMGHDLPLGLLPKLVDLVLDHARKAGELA